MSGLIAKKPTDLYDLAVNSYGLDMQMMVCIEEFSELMKEFSKYQRIVKCSNGHGVPKNLQELKEEIVDATIMIEQMKNIFFKEQLEFEEIKLSKLTRLADRLGVSYEPGQISPDGYNPNSSI